MKKVFSVFVTDENHSITDESTKSKRFFVEVYEKAEDTILIFKKEISREETTEIYYAIAERIKENSFSSSENVFEFLSRFGIGGIA